MSFHVWESTVPSSLAAWLEMWRLWPRRQVFAHPEYVALFARPDDGVTCLAFKDDKSGILLPLIIRGMQSEPWGSGTGIDATTAYGYSGPYGWNVTPETAQAFWSATLAWAEKTQLVTLFCRLPLFHEDRCTIPFISETRSHSVVRTLELEPEDMWMDYDQKVRKNVRKAVRAGLVVEHDPGAVRLDEFKAIYRETMERTGANQDYLFQDQFFDNLVKHLAGHIHLCHTMDGPKVIASELILVSEREAYSFLGGTRAEAYPLRPNDLLKHEAFLWARRAGKSTFVLGGGLVDGDGIHRYKRSFAPTSQLSFETVSATLDNERCGILVEQHKGWASEKGIPWEPIPGFFPPYRSPRLGPQLAHSEEPNK